MPEVFYDMELEDFYLMQEGFFNRRKSDHIQFANIAFFVDAIAVGLTGKKPDYKRFIGAWFGEVEKPMSREQLRERSESIMKRLDEMQKIEDEKIKLGLIKPKRGKRAKNNN